MIEMGKEIHKFIDLSNLPRNYKGIDWINTIGYKVYFEYDDIKDWIEIINFSKNDSKVTIKYETDYDGKGAKTAAADAQKVADTAKRAGDAAKRAGEEGQTGFAAMASGAAKVGAALVGTLVKVRHLQNGPLHLTVEAMAQPLGHVSEVHVLIVYLF